MKLKLEPEYIFIFIIFTALLFFGLGNLWGHTLMHETPTGYSASDAFQHQTRAEAIKVIGNYVTEPPWIAAGLTDVIGVYPPGLYYLSISLSFVGGLEVFDTIYIIAFVFSILGAILFYYIIRKFNKAVALISLPFSVLIFTGISMIGFTWGAIPSLMAQVFLILTIWVIANIDQDFSWIALGIALSAAVITHSSELVVAAGFVAFYFIINLLIHFFKKENKVVYLKKIVFGIGAFIFISWYLILLSQLTWAKLYPLNPFDVWTTHGGYPGIVNLTDYGIILLFMAIGLLAGIYLIWKNLPNPPVAPLAGFYMIVIGYGNFYGLNYRAFQIRYFWPIYLSVFLGLGIYFILQTAAKKSAYQAAFFSGLILLVAFSGIVSIPSVPHYERTGSAAVDKPHWDVFNWLRQNTPKDAIVYFFYGDLYKSNAVLRNIERVHYQILSHSNPQTTADFITKLQQGVISRTYESALLGDCCGADYPYWKGFGKIGFHFLELNRSNFYKPTDICIMDYYVFDKTASVPAFAQYNLAIANEMLKSNHFEVVYENPASVILKNNKPGDNCIGNSTA